MQSTAKRFPFKWTSPDSKAKITLYDPQRGDKGITFQGANFS